ncbi:MAG: hypothetical protein DHS20C11_38120 [Lysobacteraceae bacterium]|nr:MAG: hypothetical protein DHS20C11_38120 [Xanthomonadaceae bacterium]
MSDGERLQKLLAGAGLGSRRQLDAAIERGEVQLNGRVSKLGDRAVAGDRLQFAGSRYDVVTDQGSSRVIMYHKPIGEVTTRSDPEKRKTVFDRLPQVEGRWIAVGRLDINTSGLLLLTNDGELANQLMHPSSGVDREYACRVHGEVTDEMVARLKTGVQLEDGMACFSDIIARGNEGSNPWFHVVLMEGKNREVRRLWESQGVQVSRLKRVRYGPVFIPARLRQRYTEELSPRDVAVLREDVGLPAKNTGLTLVKQRAGRATDRTVDARPKDNNKRRAPRRGSPPRSRRPR